jgi:hypothetical protein
MVAPKERNAAVYYKDKKASNPRIVHVISSIVVAIGAKDQGVFFGTVSGIVAVNWYSVSPPWPSEIFTLTG